MSVDKNRWKSSSHSKYNLGVHIIFCPKYRRKVLIEGVEDELKKICQDVAKDLKIFEILWDKEELKKRIAKRTKIMIDQGLIDEVIFLEKTYTREPNCMASIGIIETLEYLDGKLTKKELEEKISSNTIKLAKRQNTFNKSQFTNKTSNIIENLNSDIIKYFLL